MLLPIALSPSRMQVAAPVDHGQDSDLFEPHAIDDAVAVNENLSEVRFSKLGNDASPLRKSRERATCLANLLGEQVRRRTENPDAGNPQRIRSRQQRPESKLLYEPLLEPLLHLIV